MNKKLFGSRGSMEVPVAIIIGALIIGGAVIYSVGKKSVTPPVADSGAGTNGTANVLDKVRPVSADDHILGSLDAPVKVVEYSDPECPFCKRFHQTMHQVVTDYAGKVAWIYRNFPLATLHPKAPSEAAAAECAAKLGGNDAYWKFLNRIYEITPSNNGLDPAELPNIAAYAGLDAAKFSACAASGETAAHVSADYDEAVAAGGEGTPYSIVINAKGQKTIIPGALPLENVKVIIDQALK